MMSISKGRLLDPAQSLAAQGVVNTGTSNPHDIVNAQLTIVKSWYQKPVRHPILGPRWDYYAYVDVL